MVRLEGWDGGRDLEDTHMKIDADILPGLSAYLFIFRPLDFL